MKGVLTVSVLVLAIAGVAVAAIALDGSDAGIPPRRPARTTMAAGPTAAAVCGRLTSTRTGVITSDEASELSGLVLSRTRPRVLWTHNDSGDRARVLAVRTDGTFLGSFDIPGAESVDAEDIATGPRPGGGALLYLADIGDNDAERSSVVVWRVPEPSAAGTGGTTAPPRRIELRYPDGAHDAETLLVDPRRGDLAIVTKDFGGRSVVYTAPASAGADGTVTTLRRAARLDLGFAGLATGGDVSRSGSVIVVRTYGAAFAWTRRTGESIGAAMRRRPCRSGADLAREGQGEAIALTADGRGFSTVAEGLDPPIRRYAPAGR